MVLILSTDWQVEVTLEPMQTNLVTEVGCSPAHTPDVIPLLASCP